jgi:hypothetical protein
MKRLTLLPALLLLGYLTACAPTAGTTGTGTANNSGNTSADATQGSGSGSPTANANTVDPAAGDNNVTDGKFGNQPPEAVTESFRTKYPQYTSGDWVKEEGRYTTTYMREGKSYRANFSNSGEWIDTRNDVVLDDLPAPVKQSFQNSPYGSAANPRFLQIETAQYPVLYKAEGQMNNQPFNVYLTPEGRTVEMPE